MRNIACSSLCAAATPQLTLFCQYRPSRPAPFPLAIANHSPFCAPLSTSQQLFSRISCTFDACKFRSIQQTLHFVPASPKFIQQSEQQIRKAVQYVQRRRPPSPINAASFTTRPPTQDSPHLSLVMNVRHCLLCPFIARPPFKRPCPAFAVCPGSAFPSHQSPFRRPLFRRSLFRRSLRHHSLRFLRFLLVHDRDRDLVLDLDLLDSTTSVLHKILYDVKTLIFSACAAAAAAAVIFALFRVSCCLCLRVKRTDT